MEVTARDVEGFVLRLRRYADYADRRSAFVGIVEALADDPDPLRAAGRLKALVEALHQVEQ